MSTWSARRSSSLAEWVTHRPTSTVAPSTAMTAAGPNAEYFTTASAVTQCASTESGVISPPESSNTTFSNRWVTTATTVAVTPNRTAARAGGVRHTQPAAAVPR